MIDYPVVLRQQKVTFVPIMSVMIQPPTRLPSKYLVYAAIDLVMVLNSWDIGTGGLYCLAMWRIMGDR